MNELVALPRFGITNEEKQEERTKENMKRKNESMREEKCQRNSQHFYLSVFRKTIGLAKEQKRLDFVVFTRLEQHRA